MNFDLNRAPSQKGKTAIVTGANIGLGYETTLGLAKKGAKVVMACRNTTKGEEARREIEKAVPGADLEVMHLDLNSLQSVRDFAHSFAGKHNNLHLLINNAGIMVPPYGKTAEGFESQFGVNHLGHFLLTNLLFPIVNKTAGARIITLASLAHVSGVINFDDINSEKSYSRMAAYRQSKLACLMFAYELQRRMEKSGSKVIAVSAHPGVSFTNLPQHMPAFALALAKPFAPLFTHIPEKGALPILMAAVDENVKGGEYYGPTGFRGMKGEPGKVESMPHSHNKEVAARLWELSEKMTGQPFQV